MKTLDYNKNFLPLLLAVLLLTIGCDESDENTHGDPPDIITDVTLIFSNVNDASDVVTATAQDPDREGVQGLQVMNPINLSANQIYELTFEIFNNLRSPGEELTPEIEEENEEHQIFFSFTSDAFLSPTGDGNIDIASDPINYNDEDVNGNPVGLITSWETGSTALTGNFTARLQVQPDQKTATSTATTGDTDFNLTFVLNIQ